MARSTRKTDTPEITTADGYPAVPVWEGDGNTWLLELNPSLYALVELRPGVAIEAFRWDSSTRQQYASPATDCFVHGMLERVREGDYWAGSRKPGWYYLHQDVRGEASFRTRELAQRELVGKVTARRPFFGPEQPRADRKDKKGAPVSHVGIGARKETAPYSRPSALGRWSTKRRIGRLLVTTDILPDKILVHRRVVGVPTEADLEAMAKSFGGDYLPVRQFPRNPETAAAEPWTTDGHWPVWEQPAQA